MNSKDHHNRFFLKEQDISENEFRITGEEVRHVKVKRLRKGDNIIGIDGSGGEYIGSFVKIENNEIVCRVDEIIRHGPPRDRISLAIGIIKPGGMSMVCEKAAEFGVAEVIPVYCEHSNRHINSKEIEHLNRVCMSGMKQSGRYFLTRVREEGDFADVLSEFSGGNIYIADEGGESALTITHEGDVMIFVGPEGGFSEDEIGKIIDEGGRKILLGKHRLRSETAAVLAAGVFSIYDI